MAINTEAAVRTVRRLFRHKLRHAILKSVFITYNFRGRNRFMFCMEKNAGDNPFISNS